jgi:hypothetical protein
MKEDKGVLAVLTVINKPDIEGSIVDVQLFVPLKDAKPGVQKEYDLASLGEVESERGPFENL